MFKQFAAGAALVIVSSITFAADTPSWYAGLDASSTKIDGYGRESGFKGAGGFVGYTFNEYVAIEAGYNRLANTSIFVADTPAGPSGVESRVSQTLVSVIGTLPLSSGFSVYGRLGYNRLEEKFRFRFGTDTYTENKAVIGAGLGYAFTPAIAGRVEVQKPHSDITKIAAGVALKF